MVVSDNKKLINIIILILALYLANAFLSMKKIDPGETAVQIIIIAFGILAIVVHEVSHGYMAYMLGDNTARDAGRLSLNPLKHFDPIGVLAMIMVHIGWAKPVPVDYTAFKKPRRDIILVALAGPLSNFILAVIFTVVVKYFIVFAGVNIFSNVEETGIWLAMICIKSLIIGGIHINLILMCFNLLPLPPLDGSKILMCVLPEKYARKFSELEAYGLFIILALVYFKALNPFVFGPAEYIYKHMQTFILSR